MNDSVVKILYYFSRGSEFGSELTVTSAPEDLTPISGLCGHLHPCKYTQRHVNKNILKVIRNKLMHLDFLIAQKSK